MKSILDPSFCYTSSLHTDVRKTFERVRRELQRVATGADMRSDGNGNVLALQSASVGFANVRHANGAQENGRIQRPS